MKCLKCLECVRYYSSPVWSHCTDCHHSRVCAVKPQLSPLSAASLHHDHAPKVLQTPGNAPCHLLEKSAGEILIPGCPLLLDEVGKLVTTRFYREGPLGRGIELQWGCGVSPSLCQTGEWATPGLSHLPFFPPLLLTQRPAISIPAPSDVLSCP